MHRCTAEVQNLNEQNEKLKNAWTFHALLTTNVPCVCI